MKFPHHVDLNRCTNCEEYSFGDNWIQMEETEAVEEIALRQMQLIPEAEVVSVGVMTEAQDERTFKVSVEADVAVNGYLTEDRDSIIVRLKNTVCKKCSRQLGNYYEATLQIRSGEKELSDDLRDEVVRRVRDTVETMSKNNRSLFITRVQEVAGGIDMLMSSISMTRSIAKDLSDTYGAETKESSSLVGMSSDGIDIYRLTYLVRLPAYHAGDVLEYKGKPYKLIGLNKSVCKLLALSDFRETSIRRTEVQDLKILVKYTDRKEALVLSKSDGEIQVMHPSDYSTVDLKVPKDVDIGENVDVVAVDDILYFLP